MIEPSGRPRSSSISRKCDLSEGVNSPVHGTNFIITRNERGWSLAEGQIWLVSSEFSAQWVLKRLADSMDSNSKRMALRSVNWRARIVKPDISVTCSVIVSISFMRLLSFVRSWNAAGPPLSLGALGSFAS